MVPLIIMVCDVTGTKKKNASSRYSEFVVVKFHIL